MSYLLSSLGSYCRKDERPGVGGFCASIFVARWVGFGWVWLGSVWCGLVWFGSIRFVSRVGLGSVGLGSVRFGLIRFDLFRLLTHVAAGPPSVWLYCGSSRLPLSVAGHGGTAAGLYRRFSKLETPHANVLIYGGMRCSPGRSGPLWPKQKKPAQTRAMCRKSWLTGNLAPPSDRPVRRVGAVPPSLPRSLTAEWSGGHELISITFALLRVLTLFRYLPRLAVSFCRS